MPLLQSHFTMLQLQERNKRFSKSLYEPERKYNICNELIHLISFVSVEQAFV